MLRRSPRTALVALTTALAVACAGPRPSSPVQLATEPPGVVVSVNGADSGFVTPCMIGLSIERPHRIDLALDGYVTETRLIVPDGYEQAVLWREMTIGHKTWKWPLWLNIDDFFVPVRTQAPLSPWRIYVRMKRTIDVLPPEPEAAPDGPESGEGSPAIEAPPVEPPPAE